MHIYESELTVHAIVRLFVVEFSKVMSMGIPISEPAIAHYTDYFIELLIKFKSITVTADYSCIFLMIAVMSSPSPEEAKIQSSFLSRTAELIHPNRRRRTTTSKTSLSNGTNNILKPKHPVSLRTVLCTSTCSYSIMKSIVVTSFMW